MHDLIILSLGAIIGYFLGVATLVISGNDIVKSAAKLVPPSPKADSAQVESLTVSDEWEAWEIERRALWRERLKHDPEIAEAIINRDALAYHKITQERNLIDPPLDAPLPKTRAIQNEYWYTPR